MVYIVSHLPYPAAGCLLNLLTLLGCTGAAYGRVLARRKEQAGARALSADSLLHGGIEFSAFQPQRLCTERSSRLGVLCAPICPVELPAWPLLMHAASHGQPLRVVNTLKGAVSVWGQADRRGLFPVTGRKNTWGTHLWSKKRWWARHRLLGFGFVKVLRYTRATPNNCSRHYDRKTLNLNLRHRFS